MSETFLIGHSSIGLPVNDISGSSWQCCFNIVWNHTYSKS